MIREISIYGLSFNFPDNCGLLGGEIDRDVVFINENANILIIVTEKSLKTNYKIASRIEYIIDKEVLRIKKILRVYI